MKQTRQIDLTAAVYEHAAALIGKTPGQVFRDAELLFQAHAEAFRVYGHAPVVVGIDIYNLETGTGYVICPCETDQEAFMRQMRARPDVMVRINAATGVFASGEWAAVCRELHRVLTLAGDRDNVCIGTGVLPFETNPDIVLKAKAFLREMTK